MRQKLSGSGTNAGHGKRVYKRRSREEKRRIVEETHVAGGSVSIRARRHDVNTNQLFTWRRQYQYGEFGGGAALVPVGVIGGGGTSVARNERRNGENSMTLSDLASIGSSVSGIALLISLVESVFSEEKKLSIAALSQQLPERLIDEVTA
jgi:transposase-like protein